MRTRRSAIAKQTAAISAVALVLAAAAALEYSQLQSLGSRPASTTTETVTVSDYATGAAAQVNQTFVEHMFLLTSGDASAVVGQFSKNATVSWTGTSVGPDTSVPSLNGNYTGTDSILRLINGTIASRTSSFDVGNLTWSVSVTGGSAEVDSSFSFVGYNPATYGHWNGTVSAQDSFVRASDGAWLISREAWNFLSFEWPGMYAI